MYSGFAVLSTSKPINDNICKVLIGHAIYMVEKEVKKMDFVKNDICEGVIEAMGKTFVVGGMTGQLFEAEIETDKGLIKVKFLNNFTKTKHNLPNFISPRVGYA